MREWVAYVVSFLLFVLPAIARSSSTASGSIRGDVFTKGTSGEPAVLPGVLIVLHGPITKETESDAKGAFAVDGLPPGMYDIEASAPGLNAALTVEQNAALIEPAWISPLRKAWNAGDLFPEAGTQESVKSMTSETRLSSQKDSIS